MNRIAMLCLPVLLLASLAGCGSSTNNCPDCGPDTCPVGMPPQDRPLLVRPDAPFDPGHSQPVEAPPHAPVAAPVEGSYNRPQEIPNIGRREVTLTGNVVFFEGGMAIGGEAPPSGFILRTDQYRQIYLRLHGQLEHRRFKQLENQLVRTTGRVDTIAVGGVETPRRYYAVLDVDTIDPVGSPDP